MSCDTTEFGTIYFGKTAYSTFKKKVVKFYNDRQDALLETAILLHKEAVEAKKTLKGFDSSLWMTDQFVERGHRMPFVCLSNSLRVADNERQVIFNSIFSEVVDGKSVYSSKKMSKPKRLGFRKLKAADTKSIHAGYYGELEFNDENSLIRWEIATGNGTVEETHNTTMGNYIFALLKQEKWGRNMGGVIYYADDFDNEDSDEDFDDCGDGWGGGFASKRIEHAFGPKGEKERKASRA